MRNINILNIICTKTINIIIHNKKLQLLVISAALMLTLGMFFNKIESYANYKFEINKLTQSKQNQIEIKRIKTQNVTDAESLLQLIKQFPTEKNLILTEEAILKVDDSVITKKLKNELAEIKGHMQLEKNPRELVEHLKTKEKS